MDLVERSRARLLGIIIVKDRPGTANRVDGAPSEGERLCRAGLLAHDVRKKRRGRRGNGGHFGGILADRGVDRVRGGSVGTVG